MAHSSMTSNFRLLFATFYLLATPGQGAVQQPVTGGKAQIFARTDYSIGQMIMSSDGKRIAFEPDSLPGLYVLDLKTSDIYCVTKNNVSGSFLWSPDRQRLFYRELTQQNGVITSAVKAWDHQLKNSQEIDVIPGSSGFLTLDPRDQRLMLLHEKGVMIKKLMFRQEKLAFWQSQQRSDKGKFVAAANGMTFFTQQGFAAKKLVDDASGVQSFDISPKGNMVAWSTKSNRIYVSVEGEDPKFIDFGRDPKWHPSRDVVVYAGAHMIGTKPSSYDIKVASLHGATSSLTQTQNRDETSPLWTPLGDKILYAVKGSTDIFAVNSPWP
jgi:hypothetical protein